MLTDITCTHTVVELIEKIVIQNVPYYEYYCKGRIKLLFVWNCHSPYWKTPADQILLAKNK